MTILDDYKDYKGMFTVSPSLLWEYDLSDFDWWKSRKIVVSRILEREGGYRIILQRSTYMGASEDSGKS